MFPGLDGAEHERHTSLFARCPRAFSLGHHVYLLPCADLGAVALAQPIEQFRVMPADCLQAVFLAEPLLGASGAVPCFFRMVENMQQEFGGVLCARICPFRTVRERVFARLDLDHPIIDQIATIIGELLHRGGVARSDYRQFECHRIRGQETLAFRTMQREHAIGSQHEVMAGTVLQPGVQDDCARQVRDLLLQVDELGFGRRAVRGLDEQGCPIAKIPVGIRGHSEGGDRSHWVLARHVGQKIECGVDDKSFVRDAEIGPCMYRGGGIEIQQLPGVVDGG